MTNMATTPCATSFVHDRFKGTSPVVQHWQQAYLLLALLLVLVDSCVVARSEYVLVGSGPIQSVPRPWGLAPRNVGLAPNKLVVWRCTDFSRWVIQGIRFNSVFVAPLRVHECTA